MNHPAVMRIEPSPAVLTAARRWLDPVRAALGAEFVAAYLTGSVLAPGFDERRSRINLLVVTRALGLDVLDAVAGKLPADTRPPHIHPLFVTERQMVKSLDVFPIEWTDIQEGHLLLEGHDVLGGLHVPRGNLRIQLEHDLRARLIGLRQAYLANAQRGEELGAVLKAAASGFTTLCRTLLRLRGEAPPAEARQVIQRTAELFGLDAQGLSGAHVVRHSGAPPKRGELVALYRSFLVEVERLVNAIDEMRLP